MNSETISGASDPLWGVLIRLAVEIAVLIIIVPLIYRRFSNRKEHTFPFFLMGIMIFTVCVLLKEVKIQMGMVLGLFAVFSVMRFRTFNFSTKDMSYLFAVIGLSAINSMFDYPNPVRGTIIVNTVVIITILLLELFFKESQTGLESKGSDKKKAKDEKKQGKKKAAEEHILIYDKIQLLSPGRKDELLSDIAGRTGLKITEATIRKIDLTKNIAELEISIGESDSQDRQI